MQDMINSFLSSMKADGKSSSTIETYRLDLSTFSEYVSNYIQKPLISLKSADMRLWSNSLADSGLSATTRAKKIAIVKSFFHYLSKMDYIEGKNPADILDTPKLPKKQPKVINVEDAKALMSCVKECAEEENGGITSFRDYAIIATFLMTGVRREELSNIKLADIDLENGTILINGKGNKERTVYINETLRAILSEYLSVYRDIMKPAKLSKYLFVSTRSEKIGLGGINKIVNIAMTNAGFKEKGISVHNLRKRFATTAFENTKDIATVSKLLGHSSPTVTMRYVSIGEETMRNVTNAVNF